MSIFTYTERSSSLAFSIAHRAVSLSTMVPTRRLGEEGVVLGVLLAPSLIRWDCA